MQVKQHIFVHLYFLLKQEIVNNLYGLNFLGMDLKVKSIKYSLTSLLFNSFRLSFVPNTIIFSSLCSLLL